MKEKDVKMGQLAPGWPIDGRIAKTITFCVTENCNLACKYCYMTRKNDNRRMTFEVAKKTIDTILEDKTFFSEGAVIWDFIGGEPFLEIDLIDEISDYLKQQMFIRDHPWFNAYRFSFATNGILYSSEKVQRYIKKNKNHLSIGISIDGNKIKHDLQRVYRDGRGSYDDVVKNIPLWKEQFGEVMTKATFSSDDLPYLKDSIISLWDIGVSIVAANVVFENSWKDNDDLIFEKQLMELADYVIENKLWDKVSVRFFDYKLGLPLSEESKKENYCGSGKMLAVSCDGKLFPCIRFMDFSLNNKKGLSIGDIESGINEDLLRPFQGLNFYNQSPKKCLECEVAGGCAWCTGFDYDDSEDGSIYERATYNCKMHKANVRAMEYFWRKYSEETGRLSPRDEILMNINHENKGKYLFFITQDNITPHCSYRYEGDNISVMDLATIKKGIKFAEDNDFIPVFLGDQDGSLSNLYFNHLFFMDAQDTSNYDYKNNRENIIHVYDNNIQNANIQEEICNLIISSHNIDKLYAFIKELLPYKQRINVVLEDIECWNNDNLLIYKEQLISISKLLVKNYSNNEIKEINVLTDRIYLKEFSPCDSGDASIAVAPNGKFYPCPRFYFENKEESLGDLDNGLVRKEAYIYDLVKKPICSGCDSYQCTMCKAMNKKLTREINIPSKIQCTLRHIERNQSRELQEKLISNGLTSKENVIVEIDYLDPLEKLIALERVEG